MKSKILKSVCAVALVVLLSGCVVYGPVYHHHGYWYPGGGFYVY